MSAISTHILLPFLKFLHKIPELASHCFTSTRNLKIIYSMRVRDKADMNLNTEAELMPFTSSTIFIQLLHLSPTIIVQSHYLCC